VAENFAAITYLLFAVVWVMGAWMVGVTAGKRGYNPVFWGLFALLVSPIAGAALLVLVTPRRGPGAP
jgi:hypothetical protein